MARNLSCRSQDPDRCPSSLAHRFQVTRRAQNPLRWSSALALTLSACSAAPPASRPQEGTPSPTRAQASGDAFTFASKNCSALYEHSTDYVFIEIPRGASPRIRWRALSKDEDERETTSTKKAGLTRLDGWTLVSLSITGDGGEWISFEDYCFALDGRLHELHTRHTSYAPQCDTIGTIHESLQRFDTQGNRISLKSKMRELKTSRPLDCPDEEVPLPEYTSYEDIPFAGANDDDLWYGE